MGICTRYLRTLGLRTLDGGVSNGFGVHLLGVGCRFCGFMVYRFSSVGVLRLCGFRVQVLVSSGVKISRV